MSNIVIGGYGDDSIGSYADIDWSKKTHSLQFNVTEVYDIMFKIETVPITFEIKSSAVLFNINIYQETFKTTISDLKFTVAGC